MHADLEQLSTTPRNLRKFGLLVGGVFLLLGGWFFFRHKPVWPYLAAPGTVLLLVALLAPRALKRAYLGWMALALALGFVVSNALLTIFFFFVVTPLAFLARIFGQDFLSLRLRPDAESYWLARDRSTMRKPSDYERQF